MSIETAERNPHGQVTIQVPRPVHGRLSMLQGHLQTARGRSVSYGEVIEWLLTIYAEDEASQ